MKVALATDSAEPSGLGRHMLDLAGALRGVEPILGFADLPAGRRFARAARDRGLRAEAVADWRAWLDRERPRLVHVHAGIGWEGHGLVAAGRAARLAVVRTEHLPWLVTCPDQRAAYAAMVADVAAIVAVSRDSRESWREALRTMPGPRLPLFCVPNGVPEPPAHPSRRDGRTLLAVGRLQPQKGHATLLRALRLLPGLRLLIAGDGPEEEALRLQAEGLDVAFLGRRGDVPALMAQADLLVMPSGFEGLPLVVLEAMAAGLPVVATGIGPNVEALGGDHPWLVPPGDAPALAEAVRAAMSDPEARRRQALAGRRRWEKRFTAGRMAASTARAYRAALGQGRGRGMTRTRVGFVGAGGIAHRHFGTLLAMSDVEIRAVADPDEARRREAAERTGATPYAHHDEMLAAETLDALYICVPPFAHGAPERAAIAKGLPFFVEKPLSLDISLAESIADEVEAAGLVTATGYHWRYLDTVEEARRHLAANPAHLLQGFWIDQTPPPRWWWREDESGGQVVEQATHLIDLARFLAGDVVEVFGAAARRDREGFEGLDVPTASVATLRFASGAVANLAATCLLRWNHRVGLHVFADALALEITDHDLMVDVGQGRPVRGADGDPVWREDRDFIEAVQGHESRIRSPYRDALETHRVALAVARSARSGQPVSTGGPRSNPRPPFRRAAAADASLA